MGLQCYCQTSLSILWMSSTCMLPSSLACSLSTCLQQGSEVYLTVQMVLVYAASQELKFWSHRSVYQRNKLWNISCTFLFHEPTAIEVSNSHSALITSSVSTDWTFDLRERNPPNVDSKISAVRSHLMETATHSTCQSWKKAFLHDH